MLLAEHDLPLEIFGKKKKVHSIHLDIDVGGNNNESEVKKDYLYEARLDSPTVSGASPRSLNPSLGMSNPSDGAPGMSSPSSSKGSLDTDLKKTYKVMRKSGTFDWDELK